MVSAALVRGANLIVPLWAQADQLPITRLEPTARARVVGSLVLLTIGGIALVVLAWLAIRVGRRYVARADDALPSRARRPLADDWAERPLVKGDPTKLDDANPR